MKSAFLATAVALAIPIATIHQSFADTKSGKTARNSLEEATEVYRSVSQDSKHKVPASVLNKASCVAIFPDAVTVSLGVGGSHSDGVAFCKTASGQWENPMFLNMTGGSIGVQAGVKSSDIVMYFTGDKAVTDLKAGKFTVGGEASAVAGSFDESFRPNNAQVVAYTRSKGLFAGASVDGVNISRDHDDELAFYGTDKPSLTAKLPSDTERLVNDLRDRLPSHVG